MKKIEDFGIRVPEILLPKNIDVSSWSVIACDQYTQDLDYWKRAEAAAESPERPVQRGGREHLHGLARDRHRAHRRHDAGELPVLTDHR